jgi:hypothetical protein
MNNMFKKLNKMQLLIVVALGSMTGCTKLDQELNSTLTSGQASTALGANGTQLLLQTAYNDVGNPFADPGNIFALEEVTADGCVVPTRAGDWDDNGKWRALKKHTWGPDGVDVIINQFNSLNKLNFDATNVLAFNPTPVQKAEARFLRALALYQLLDLYGQFPFREAGENLLNAPRVYSGEEAVQFIITELNEAVKDLPAGNPMEKANKDAANFLLMKLYLNHGAFVNRKTPTFSNADMQKVIDLGTAMTPRAYKANYFDNFNPTNHTTSEGIFAAPNTAGVATNNNRIDNRWWATLHYNSYTPLAPQAGWNGFSTLADFYNSFAVNGAVAKQTPEDTLLDPRIGGRFYPGCTDAPGSGLRPGLLIGQQYDDKGVARKDRKGNNLAFKPDIIFDLKETGNDLEIKGIRVLKYVPDFSDNGKNFSNQAGNWLILFRYSEVVLMIAEAKMRLSTPDNAGALTIVNDLRSKRGAPALNTMTLVNLANLKDPNTLLAERGRELYWEVGRRTDMIRFGVFTKANALKPETGDTYLVFPIPSGALAANPNLTQNPGYN